MYQDFTNLVLRALDKGLQPAFETTVYEGEIWHGTNLENAQSIEKHGWNPDQSSWNTWFGPAFCGFTNHEPIIWQPLLEAPEDPSQRGRWAAECFAAAKIKSLTTLLDGEVAVVQASVRIERVMNLEDIANEELLEGLRRDSLQLAGEARLETERRRRGIRG